MLDPRLTDVTLLGLAALRLRQRQAQPPPGRKVVLRVEYENLLGEEPMEGFEVTYIVPDNGSPARRVE
jgi:hypothetical protein